MLYINGVLQTMTAPTDISANGDLNSGSDLSLYSGTGSTGHFAGCITGVSLHKGVALNAGKVLELYNDGKELDVTTFSGYSAVEGYWRNNGLSTWTDLSTNSNNGTVTGSETLLIPQGVDGSRDAQGFIMNRERNTSSLNFPVDKSSQTPSLDTGSYVEVNDYSGLTFGTGNFSMECWVKPLYRSKGSSGLNTIFTLGGQVNDADSAGLCVSSANIEAHIGGVIMSEGYSTNNWHHVVATREGLGSGEMKLYINGVEEATGTSVANPSGSPATGTNLNNAHNMTIGAEDNRTRGYEDAVDGVKVYNKALSLTEVQRNYNATKGVHTN